MFFITTLISYISIQKKVAPYIKEMKTLHILVYCSRKRKMDEWLHTILWGIQRVNGRTWELYQS